MTLLVGAAMFVRVMYLQVFHPEYLNPRRRGKVERDKKTRVWARNKVKQGGNRLGQDGSKHDGKGGRSGNSKS
jgi:hypothetical protein